MNISNAYQVVKTLISFEELLEPENINFLELSHSLIESVRENYSDRFSAMDMNRLESNLLKIFENSKSLKMTFKAFNLLSENSNLYISGKITTDIRLIFDDNITEPRRNAVIIHKLHLTLQTDTRNNSIFITLDRSDLKELRDIVDRALLKEDLIREDYENINFVNR